MNKMVFCYSCEKKQTYTPVVDTNVTAFWSKLFPYVKEHYPGLSIYESTGPWGSNALWPTFRTGIKGCSIVWKSQKGVIDLEFTGMAGKNTILLNAFKDENLNDYRLVETGKSLSLRISMASHHTVDFRQPFENQVDNINNCLSRAFEFALIADRLSKSGISSFPIE